MQTVDRLITYFVPEQYDLSITLLRERRQFYGTLTVKGELQPDAPHLVLHSKDLAIKSVTVDGKVADFAASDNDELFITHPDLIAGEHIIVITYDAIITDGMHGLYPCYYEHDGIKKELLATQFESHHAREVFPCIDEPDAKAIYNLTLTTELGVTVLGNMPISIQRDEDGMLVTTFETSPRMSSYLLAWVVGEMHRKSGTTKRGVEVNIWATPAQPANSLDFALDVAIRSIDYYEAYFDIEYPLPKSDHVALPDFSSGAMENWGLITYREIALLADPLTSGISSKQSIATVVAHELAHQWFGNLVTMKWWNNLWLNESFANMMEYVTTDALFPEWNMWLEFATHESIYALKRDSIDGVQAVQTDVHHPDEISSLFDGAIVYAKGGRLLRMLQHYVGQDAFQAGLTAYFKEFAYKNTEADDLWNAIAKTSGMDIMGLMNTWISQPGYPVLSVTTDNDRVTLTQEQFFVGQHEMSDRLWPIPLNSSCNEMPKLLTEKTVTVTRHHTTPLRFNVGDTAHFITQYDPILMERLVDEVREGTMDPLDRLQLLHETVLLAKGDRLPSTQLLDLLPAYEHETNESVWDIIFMALGELRKFTEDDKEAEQKLRTLSAKIAKTQFERLGWVAATNEPEEDTKLRSTILSLTIYGEDPQVINKAKELYANSSLESLDPELRPLIISTVVRHGDSTIVDNLLKEYKTTQSSELRQDISVGITSTRIPEKINELLSLIKDPSIVRPQDAAYWFVYLIRGRESRQLAWQWIQNNWQWVIDTFGSDKSYDDYPRYSAGALTTRNQLKEYIDFFSPKKEIPALTRVITMGISEIEAKVNIIERDGPAVRVKLLEL